MSRPARTSAAGDLAQEPVAGLVALLVVDRLKSSRSSMIRLNGAAVAGASLEPLLERAVVEQAGQLVGPGADLDGAVDLRVLERDRDLRGEQLDELELLGRERVADAEPLDGQDAVAPPRPRSGTTIRLPSIGADASRKWLTRGSFRSSSTSTGSLCSRTHVATPVSPSSHGSR